MAKQGRDCHNGQDNGGWEKEGAKVERGMDGIQGSGNVLVLNLGGGYSVICLSYCLTCTFMSQCTSILTY